jgi:uncharacterized membrane protein
MKHFWHILFVAFTLLSITYPWLLVASLAAVVLLVQQERSKQRELVEAIEQYRLAKEREDAQGEKFKVLAAEFNSRLEQLNDLQKQVDNVKSAAALGFRK